jgi:regulatory protein
VDDHADRLDDPVELPDNPVLLDRGEHAIGIAYSYLNRRDRTVLEVRRHLERAGVDEATVEQTILTLTDQGYLDDARFARLFAEDKRELEHWGSERVERGLLARGIDRELVRDVITQSSGENELERALSLLRRRFPAAPRDRRDRDRALGVLLRKGYDSELALEAIAAHAREAEAEAA